MQAIIQRVRLIPSRHGNNTYAFGCICRFITLFISFIKQFLCLGFVTSTAINPVWLVKTRLQLHRGPLSIRECIKKIYKHEGPRGFYKVRILSLIYALINRCRA